MPPASLTKDCRCPLTSEVMVGMGLSVCVGERRGTRLKIMGVVGSWGKMGVKEPGAPLLF